MICALTAGNSFSAAHTAFVKNDMKPRPTPYFSLNCSLYFDLKSITGFMSTSLNVVSIAVSLFTATNRLAMVLRNEDIFSDRLVRVPPDAITGGADAAADFVASGFAAGVADALEASSFVILPPTPEPET